MQAAVPSILELQQQAVEVKHCQLTTYKHMSIA